MTPIVEIVNLKKRYPPVAGAKEGQLAVKGINLTIERGEIFSLLGPNGAGKTTTISMMSDLLTSIPAGLPNSRMFPLLPVQTRSTDSL